MNLNFKKNNNTNMKNPKVPEGNRSARRSAHRRPKCPKDVEVPVGGQSARRNNLKTDLIALYCIVIIFK